MSIARIYAWSGMKISIILHIVPAVSILLCKSIVPLYAYYKHISFTVLLYRSLSIVHMHVWYCDIDTEYRWNIDIDNSPNTSSYLL